MNQDLYRIVQNNVSPSVRALNNFLKSGSFRTERGDSNTNIIDQKEKNTYNIQNENLDHFFSLLEACRKEDCVISFMERQEPISGIMLDFDILQADTESHIDESTYRKLINHIGRELITTLKFAENTEEYNFHVFIIRKPQTVPSGEGHKDGIHILIPAIQVSKAYKRWLISKINPKVAKIFANFNLVIEPTDVLDKNSASVPVLFLGNARTGKTAYKLDAVYNTTLNIEDQYVTVSNVTGEVIGNNYNLSHEMSLNYSVNSPNALVTKRKFEYSATLEEQIKDFNEHLPFADINEDDEEENEPLSIQRIHNPDIARLKEVLGILPIEYATDRNLWRNVIFALANTSPKMKSLAMWFSKRAADKWNKQAFDDLWTYATTHISKNPLTQKSIMCWARKHNPEKLKEINDRNHTNILLDFAFRCQGLIQHGMVARLLYAMFGDKYAVDTDDDVRETRLWYEFIIPGQPMKAGEVFKWRREGHYPDNLYNYLTDGLDSLYEQVIRYVTEQREKADSESYAKYYAIVLKNLAKSRVNLYNSGYKAGVIKECQHIFRKRNFRENLDTNDDIMGVGNGILKLGPKIELIHAYHEYPISKFTDVPYVKYDPNDYYVKVIESAIEDIFPEEDVREKILMLYSLALSSAPKPTIHLTLYGGGANGKSFLNQLMTNTLGKQYAQKIPVTVFMDQRERADQANSAMMLAKGRNFLHGSETGPNDDYNMARIKDFHSHEDASCRQLRKEQDSFEIHAITVVASNYKLGVKGATDYGSKRRMYMYTMKHRFVDHPKNQYQRKKDRRFTEEYIRDINYRRAFLSILGHYWERLHEEYGGDFSRVHSSTLDRETEEFWNSQDVFSRFISDRVVISPDHELDPTILSAAFKDWHNANIKTCHYTPQFITEQFENSAIDQYFTKNDHGHLIIRGIRLLKDGDEELEDGEQYFSATKREAETDIEKMRDAGFRKGKKKITKIKRELDDIFDDVQAMDRGAVLMQGASQYVEEEIVEYIEDSEDELESIEEESDHTPGAEELEIATIESESDSESVKMRNDNIMDLVE